MREYIFHRGKTFYIIELKNDQDAIENAWFNKGTTKVTDLNGKVIWKEPSMPTRNIFKNRKDD